MERQIVFEALERCGGNQGKAAQALGISRRTLLRKLKGYRENEMEPTVGSLGAEQQRYYRKETSTPIRMRYADGYLEATLLNISVGGAAVSIPRLLGLGTQVSLCFTIPASNMEAELPGRIAWANREGHHGIQFGEIPADIQTNLQRWFQAEMKKDGWRDQSAD
jgi:hypothetical protein